MKTSDLIKALELNEVNNETTLKVLKLKALAEELGWEMSDYDVMDGKFFATFSISTKQKHN